MSFAVDVELRASCTASSCARKQNHRHLRAMDGHTATRFLTLAVLSLLGVPRKQMAIPRYDPNKLVKKVGVNHQNSIRPFKVLARLQHLFLAGRVWWQ